MQANQSITINFNKKVGRNMRRNILVILIIVVSISLLYSVSKRNTGPGGEVLVRINNYSMTVDDLKDKIKHSPYSSQMISDLEQFLDLAIREQVLIQEAQRQGLDREKTFMRTIERYWAQTLIKELLDKQSQKIYENVNADKRDAAMDVWQEELYKKADIKINKDVLEQMKK